MRGGRAKGTQNHPIKKPPALISGARGFPYFLIQNTASIGPHVGIDRSCFKINTHLIVADWLHIHTAVELVRRFGTINTIYAIVDGLSFTKIGSSETLFRDAFFH